jgi:hypothetical protein
LAGIALPALAESAGGNQAGYYRKLSCQQLLETGRQVAAHAATLASGLKQGRANDVASTQDVVELPKIISEAKLVSGELALAKQQLLAIEDASIQSQCPIEFRDR